MSSVYLLRNHKVISIEQPDIPTKELAVTKRLKRLKNRVSTKDAWETIERYDPEKQELALEFVRAAASLAMIIEYHEYSFDHVITLASDTIPDVFYEYRSFDDELRAAIRVICKATFTDTWNKVVSDKQHPQDLQTIL